MQVNGLVPRWASPPGETIKAALKERGLHTADLADPLGMRIREVNELLQGHISITMSMARVLENVVGGSPEFWLARDAQYLDDSARVLADHWSGALPVAQMVQLGWIPDPHDWLERIEECLAFFDIADVVEFRERYEIQINRSHFRTSHTFEVDKSAAAVWFRACERVGDQVDVSDRYSHDVFSHSLELARALTWTKRPEVFLPKLTQLCAGGGVRLAVVPTLDHVPVSGVARLYRGAPLIQLSARFLSDDQFWFTFFHEAGHVMLHNLDTPFIDSDNIQDDGSGENREQEANDFARSMLIGSCDLSLSSYSHQSILELAKKVGVAPGIIVGQLQHAGYIPKSHLNKLKRRYVWNGTSLGTPKTD